jgi:hypothetical protein
MIMPGLPEPELFTDDSAKRLGAVTRPTAHRPVSVMPDTGPRRAALMFAM